MVRARFFIAMSTTRNSKIRTLERAVAAFGEAQKLATYLDVELAQLEDWIAGRLDTPPQVFADALDVVAAGPFAGWRLHDPERAQRHRAHADHLQEIAQRIRASAERAQCIADQAQRNADRTTALAQVQQVLASAINEQISAHAARLPSDELVGEPSTDK